MEDEGMIPPPTPLSNEDSAADRTLNMQHCGRGAVVCPKDSFRPRHLPPHRRYAPPLLPEERVGVRRTVSGWGPAAEPRPLLASTSGCQPKAASREPSYGQIGALKLKTSVRVVRASRCVRLCRAEYRSMFVGKYRQTYRRLRTRLRHELCLSFHLDLNLNLNLNLHPLLYHALFAKSYESLLQQLFVALRMTLCRSKYLSLFLRKFRQMCIQLRSQLHRQMRRQLNSELYRELRERLHASLYNALFA
jgi:hypothetical protein